MLLRSAYIGAIELLKKFKQHHGLIANKVGFVVVGTGFAAGLVYFVFCL